VLALGHCAQRLLLVIRRVKKGWITHDEGDGFGFGKSGQEQGGLTCGFDKTYVGLEIVYFDKGLGVGD
jgi:hypothetical protein